MFRVCMYGDVAVVVSCAFFCVCKGVVKIAEDTELVAR